MSQVVLKPIDTKERAGEVLSLPVIASTKLYAGTLLALVSASGFITYAQDATGQIVLGRCEEDADNTAGGTGGEINVRVKRGVFTFKNSTAHALTALKVGAVCYVEDEQTVALSSTNSNIAGIFLGFTDDLKCYVDTRRHAA